MASQALILKPLIIVGIARNPGIRSVTDGILAAAGWDVRVLRCTDIDDEGLIYPGHLLLAFL